MEMVHVLDHPLLQHKVSILRDVNTGVKDPTDRTESATLCRAFVNAARQAAF